MFDHRCKAPFHWIRPSHPHVNFAIFFYPWYFSASQKGRRIFNESWISCQKWCAVDFNLSSLNYFWPSERAILHSKSIMYVFRIIEINGGKLRRWQCNYSDTIIFIGIELGVISRKRWIGQRPLKLARDTVTENYVGEENWITQINHRSSLKYIDNVDPTHRLRCFLAIILGDDDVCEPFIDLTNFRPVRHPVNQQRIANESNIQWM